MNANLTPNTPVAPRAERPLIGRVISVDGSTAKIELDPDRQPHADTMRATVGKFVGILGNNSIIVGMVTEIAEQPRTAAGQPSTSAARMDLFGEIKTSGSGVAFSRGVSELSGDRRIRHSDERSRIAPGLWRHRRRRHDRHAASGLLDRRTGQYRRIAQQAFRHPRHHRRRQIERRRHRAAADSRQSRPDLRIFLVDPHNEYGRCFGDKAQVLTPRNLRLPFWLFNFDETLEAFFGGRTRRRGRNRNSLGSQFRSRRPPICNIATRRATASSTSAAIRRIPVTPPTRRFPIASRISSA